MMTKIALGTGAGNGIGQAESAPDELPMVSVERHCRLAGRGAPRSPSMKGLYV
jgi:hypothetical protein